MSAARFRRTETMMGRTVSNVSNLLRKRLCEWNYDPGAEQRTIHAWMPGRTLVHENLYT